ncbi:CHAP domain-containing protein, partial [Solirubrobacter taibaiensis]|nr:CHAP domain-containing protein [Solirubrobacter taibaiensis]
MATSPTEADVAARLIERLLADPSFRARFRRDPAGACREAGLDQLAQEMSLGGGKAFHTLDIRESKSSLAGVMMAAAMEGVGIWQFSENVLPGLKELPSHVADVVSRVDLPAISMPGGGGDDAAPAAPAAPEPDAPAPAPGAGATLPASSDVPGVAGAQDVPGVASADGAGSAPPAAAGAAPAAPPPPAAAPPAEAPADAPKATEADAPKEPKAPKDDPAAEAAKKIADENSPEAAKRAQEEAAANALDETTSGVPGSDALPGAPEGDGASGDVPSGAVAVTPESGKSGGITGAARRLTRRFGGGGAKGSDPSLPPGGDAPASAPAWGGVPSSAAGAGDPSLPGGASADSSLPAAAPENSLPGDAPPEAGGDPSLPAASADSLPTDAPVELPASPPTPQALALLANKNVVIDAPGVAEINAGRVDARVVGVLTQLSQEHKITVSALKSADGGMDISAVDGEMVNPDSGAARDLASALAELPPGLRPDSVGSPWAIAAPGFFTDGVHQDHLSVAFKEVAPAPPAAPVAAPAPAVAVPAAVPAVAAAGVQTPVVPVEPAFDPTKSDAFLPAVKARAVASSADRAPDPRDSQAFLPAIEKKPAAAQPAQFTGQPAGAPVDISAVAAAAPEAYPGNDAPKEQLAAWMAGQAEKRGLPPELPVMAALVESGMKNLNYGDADSIGFFQMRVSIWDQGPYKGYGDKPELQVKWFLDEAEKVKNARVAAGKPIDDPDHYGEWIADTERPAAQYRYRYQTKLSEAKGLLSSRAAAPQPVAAAAAVVDAGVVPAPAGGGLGGAALGVAKGELGVREVGTNAGPKVDEYLAAAKVPSGNPWCASFITWSLEKVGHKMPGGGWAAVQTWVRNAEQGKNGLQIVSAADARPGDIVAYDWGGQNDFGADGHIGFLDSTVQDGKFKALEGNNADAVSSVDRNTNVGNVVFIRVNGDAPAGAGVPVQPGAPAVQPAPAAATPPVDPKQFGGAEVGTGGPPNAEALALLANKNVVLDDVGKADIKAGRIDPRVIGVLTKLSQEHKITVSCMCSDHSKFTAGGSISNHFYGRGLDIAAIDGEIVGPGSPLAREIASEVSTLDPDIRPNEIGSPFAISGPGYFTDAAHQNHLHLGFKQEISPDWKPPADVAAGPAVAAPGAVPGQFAAVAPGTPVAAAAAVPAEPAFDPSQSNAFLPAVKATASAASAADRAPDPRDSQAFLPAIEKPAAPAQAAAASRIV